MTPKKQFVGNGKGIASSSEQEPQREGRKKRRYEEEQRADDQAKWKESLGKRGVKNERYVNTATDHPAMAIFKAALDRQGLAAWYENGNPGYNRALVQEFYRNMHVPKDYRDPEAKIFSKIGREPVVITVGKIAAFLSYERPKGEINYPRPIDMPVDPGLIVDHIYERRGDFTRPPYQPGRLKQDYRLVNQLICYNILPRGTENKPGETVGELMWAFMDPDTVCDWALYIFGQMVEYRWMPRVVRMPFPCMLTNIFWVEHQKEQIRLAQQYFRRDTLDPGEINATVLLRSMGQRGRPQPVTAPLTTMPDPESNMKVWLKKIFYQNVAIMDSHRKIKTKLVAFQRGVVDNDAKLDHYIKLTRGETSEPYVPRDWPELEVSDDFAGQGDDDDDEVGDEIEEDDD